jgi:hypothetical protein
LSLIACAPAPETPETTALAAKKELNSQDATSTRSSSDNDPTEAADAMAALEQNCAAKKFYFDIAKGICTTRPLAGFKCDLDELLADESTVLAINQKAQIRSHFESDLKGYALRACIDDSRSESPRPQYTLMAVKEDLAVNKIYVRSLVVPQ